MFCTYTCQGNLHCMASKIEHFDQMSSSSYPIKQEYKSFDQMSSSSYPIKQEYKSFVQMSSSSYPIKQEYKSSYPHYDFGMESTRMKSLVENYVKTLPPPNKSKEMPMDKSRF